jgi:hypothetical protein
MTVSVARGEDIVLIRRGVPAAVAVTSLLAFAVAAMAEDAKPAESGNARPVEAAAAPAPAPRFDVDAAKLPASYDGSDIVALFSALAEKAPLKKGEVEATADWEKRAASAVTDEIYALRYNEKASLFGLLISYDADAQKFNIRVQTEYTDAQKFYRPCVVLKKTGEQESTYVATNAFGAQRTVTKRTGTMFGIAPVNYKALGSTWQYSASHKKPAGPAGRLLLDLPATPDRAKALKDNLAVLLVSKLALYKEDRSPFRNGNDLLVTDFDFREPTMTFPLHESFERKFINAKVLAVWLYDRASGEILLKKQLD